MGPNPRRNTEAAALFQFGEFTFDYGSRLLLRGGVRKHLSAKAYQLLELLLAARPKALSRQQLYDALWPSTFVCETNLASVVNELRRALGDKARAPRYIRTVHGFGYAFCDEIEAPAGSRSVAMLLCGSRRHPLYEGENSVGRALDCSVVLAEATISRCHAVITVHGNTISITDLDSTNGTYVDGERIGGTPVTVGNGARIAFGSLRVSIQLRKSPSTETLQFDVSGMLAACGTCEATREVD